MTYFFDANFSPRHVRALAAMDEDVIHLQSRFPRNAADEEWIPYLKEKRWALVSFDTRIVRNPQQRTVLEDAGIVSFMCAKRVVNLPDWDIFVWLVRSWPAIKKAWRSTNRPTTFRVSIQHKVTPWGKK